MKLTPFNYVVLISKVIHINFKIDIIFIEPLFLLWTPHRTIDLNYSLLTNTLTLILALIAY